MNIEELIRNQQKTVAASKKVMRLVNEDYVSEGTDITKPVFKAIEEAHKRKIDVLRALNQLQRYKRREALTNALCKMFS